VDGGGIENGGAGEGSDWRVLMLMVSSLIDYFRYLIDCQLVVDVWGTSDVILDIR
jgi:hypothetical protein